MPNEPNPDSEHGRDEAQPADPESQPQSDPAAVDATPAIPAAPDDIAAAEEPTPPPGFRPFSPSAFGVGSE